MKYQTLTVPMDPSGRNVTTGKWQTYNFYVKHCKLMNFKIPLMSFRTQRVQENRHVCMRMLMHIKHSSCVFLGHQSNLVSCVLHYC